jgi:homoserine dehydrogenase
LLVTLAFGVLVKPDQVYTEGITRITQADITYARELGYAIKLLAIAKDDDGAIEARVHPTMIPLKHVLASIGGAYNAIYIQGDALGSTMYSGLGAGQMPSATAVMADILDIARHRLAAGSARTHALGFPVALMKRAIVKPMDDVVCEYYLRFMAKDIPGVLGAIASVLGSHGLSIASVIQKDRGKLRTVPVIMRTHEAPERSLKRALAEIRRKKIVQAAPAFIRIEENL